MSRKYKVGHCFTIAWLQETYKKHGIAHIATDGVYIQMKKEIKKTLRDCSPKRANKKIT